jgi:hypothetical protein
MAGKHSVLTVNEDRDQKAELGDGACKLINLRLPMKARIIPVRPQLSERELLNFKTLIAAR